MQKEIINLEFVQGVNFENNDSLKYNGTKYLLIFDNSCEEIGNSKAFVDIGTTGRHRGLITIYFEHNLFHQSRLGRDVELQNTHMVLFKSPRGVMQVTTHSTQLGLVTELFDWYRDAKSVPFGHLLIGLSPWTDESLRYCTNSGSVPSKFYIPDRLKHLKTLYNRHTKSLYSPSVPIASPQMQKSLSSVLPQRVCPFSMQRLSKSAHWDLQAIKGQHVVKFQDEVWLLFLKRTTWKERRNNLSSEKWLQLITIITPPVIDRLSWYGAVCASPSFCVYEE